MYAIALPLFGRRLPQLAALGVPASGGTPLPSGTNSSLPFITLKHSETSEKELGIDPRDILLFEKKWKRRACGLQEYQQTQYLQKRAGGVASGEEGAGVDKPPHCDGHDELGCYQVTDDAHLARLLF